MFGFADLCLGRIAKILMDHGFKYAVANAAVSNQKIWSAMQHDEEPTERYMLMWPPFGDHIFYEPHQIHLLPKDLASATKNRDGFYVLINLADIQRYVADALNDAEAAQGARAIASKAEMPE